MREDRLFFSPSSHLNWLLDLTRGLMNSCVRLFIRVQVNGLNRNYGVVLNKIFYLNRRQRAWSLMDFEISDLDVFYNTQKRL